MGTLTMLKCLYAMCRCEISSWTWTWRVPAHGEIAKCAAHKEAVANNESEGRITAQRMTDFHHLPCCCTPLTKSASFTNPRKHVIKGNYTWPYKTALLWNMPLSVHSVKHYSLSSVSQLLSRRSLRHLVLRKTSLKRWSRWFAWEIWKCLLFEP